MDTENEIQEDIKHILIFDSKGDYYCETNGVTNAGKITGANPSNIFRVANNGDIISTSDYYFISRSTTRQTIADLELAIKLIIICKDTRGLSNRIREILKTIKK
jgi:hypothetical protein